ncbi:acetate kinase [Halosquirtibacter xylanolyticus]|uniref:acetate/propionate family kinase n=1 Tax=Halosquirtibacter xylanolyticus TaxID=3374599 RepID=UPI00374A3619|nr:acetate kinase [Prolixibacteraceae bacterium]
MKVLVLNCGSSSIKYQLINMNTEAVLAIGLVDKVGMTGSYLKHEKESGEEVIFEGEILDHSAGIEYVLGVLTSEKHGCLKDLNEIDAVGHRVVHGGERFNSSVFITEEVVKEMQKCIDLAPLHNPPNLSGIEAISSLIPDVPQCGVFDTAFHQTMPEHSYMYAIPYKLYEKYGIRRYGFHGTSHRYVSERACEILGLDYKNSKLITCHLGNGGSLAAIKNGESMDTSMGFTPVEGLMMGTRCGDLDVGAVTYIMEKEQIGIKSFNTLANKHSGLLGVSGVSSDGRDVRKGVDEGNARCKLAVDMFDYRVKKYIGAYAAAMGGVDAIIFTGGIGENAMDHRESICSDLEFLGCQMDTEKNKVRGKEAVFSTDDSRVKLIVVPTNEELVIARDTIEIIKNR